MFRRVMVALSLGVAACAGPKSGSQEERPNRSLISEAELPPSGTETVFDLVQRIRPEYLRQRPQGGQSVLAVFTNGQLLGDVTELKRIPVSSVKEVKHYSIEQAKNRFGMQFTGGVIELVYR